MADKLYHQQPCFCIPCRVIRSEKTVPAKQEAENGAQGPSNRKPKARSPKKG